MDKVSIVSIDGTNLTYADYDAAKMAAVFGDLIIIFADLDEEITLINGVNIWIMDGVEVKNSSGPTIVDESGDPISCRIYGNGKIFNQYYNCVYLTQSTTSLKMECDSIISNAQDTGVWAVYIKSAAQYYLKCNYMRSDWVALSLGQIGVNDTAIPDVNIRVRKIETTTESSATTAVVSRSVGFFEIDQIICNREGHCFSHREGDVTAVIRNMKKTNRVNNSNTAVLHLGGATIQGTGDQKLTIYFDEILATDISANSSGFGVEVAGGYIAAIGRTVFASKGRGMSLGNPIKRGSFNVINFISASVDWALNIAIFDADVLINSKLISANYTLTGNGNSHAIYMAGTNVLTPRCNIKNAYVRNTGTVQTGYKSNGIYTEDTDVSLETNNLKIVTIDEGINSPNGTLPVKNYGLFGNEGLNNITLEIGTTGNDLFIEDPDLAN